MRSTTSQEICQMAETLGRKVSQIKEWIRNYRKKLSGKNYARTPVLYTKGPSTYNKFCRQNPLSNVDNKFQKWAEMWQEVTPEDKQHLRDDSPETTDVDKSKTCTKLEELGVESAVMFHTGSLTITGSRKGELFLRNALHIQEQFAHQIDCSYVTAPEDVKCLHQKVQDLMNKKYYEATGKAKFPYSRLQEEVFVQGLPEGFVMQKPSFLGMQRCKQILQAEGSIRVIVQRQQPKNDAADELLPAPEPPSVVDHQFMEQEEQISSALEEISRNVPLPVLEVEADVHHAYDTVSAQEMPGSTICLESVSAPESLREASNFGLDGKSTHQENHDNKMWAFKGILRKRRRRRQNEYLVKWEGNFEPSWEPEKNIPVLFRKNISKLK